MIRTSQEYLDSIRDGREVYINGERVKDVTHPMFKPLVDIRARIYDMQHEAATRDIMSFREDGERNAVGQQAAPYAGGLVGQAPRHRHDSRGHRRRRDARRRRDGRRDVVAVRRPGRAQRGRSAVLDEHPPPHRGGARSRSVPRLGQHRSQGRPLEAAAGAGSRHAAACRARRPMRASSCAAPSTRPPRPTPTRPSPSRPSPTGATPRCRTMPSASSAISARRTSNSSAAPASPAVRRRPTIRWRTASTRSTRWSSSTTC